MKRTRLVFLCVVMLGVSSGMLSIHSPLFATEEDQFHVIVHHSNTRSEITQEELSNMFLKKISRWKRSNELIHPVDLQEDSAIRETFSKMIHGRKVTSIKAYWQRQIFSGREIPPPEKENDRDILEFVSQEAGAIGYVSASVDIHEYDVKLITVIEE